MTNYEVKILSIDGKVDNDLSLNFNFQNKFLNSDKEKSLASIVKYRKYRRIPFLNKYLHNKQREAYKIQSEQFKLTRSIYQRSDEYKATRGY